MKTLLFSNQGLSPSHLGIELEIIEEEIAKENDVRVLYCKSNLESCFFNASHNLLACSICEGRTKVFYDKINFPKNNIVSLKNIVSNFDMEEIESTDDIFELKYKGYNIGRGIAASYISTRRNYEYDRSDQEFIQEMAIMSANIIENIESQITTFQPEKVILFNGRFAEQNAIIEVCKRHHIEYFTFERSSAAGKYKIFKNTLPHSLANTATEITMLWNEESDIDKNKTSINWFESRQNGGTGLIKKFLTKQEKGTLPTSFDTKKENIAIFITSEDEHKAVKEHFFEHYANQNEVIKLILNHFKNNSKLHFYLRVHPNLRNLDSAQTQEIKTFNYPNLTIIQAEEKIDTYELMKACNRIVTFGSTTGIEAAFLGKPSILFGHSYYQSLDCAYYPNSNEELLKLIENVDLKPKPIENTYPYAFHQSFVGIKLTRFDDKGKDNSSYNGKSMKRVYPKTLGILSRNLSNYSHWKKMNQLIFKEPLALTNMFKLNSHILNDKLN